jgi:hypothetical protein
LCWANTTAWFASSRATSSSVPVRTIGMSPGSTSQPPASGQALTPVAIE